MAVGDPEGAPGCMVEAALLRAAPMLAMAVRTDGQIVYVNPGVRDVVGYEPDEIVGTNLLDYLHPDDAKRAVLTMTWRDEGGRPPSGRTKFRARHKNLGYVAVETMGSTIVVDGEEHLGVYVRPAQARSIAEELLTMVVHGAARADALAAALDCVEWAEHGAQVAIAWPEADGLRQVNTGLPEELTGVEPNGAGNPWADATARRGEVRRCVDEVDPRTAASAKGAGLEELWVQPVSWSEDQAPALVTIWARGGVHAPEIHGYGMEMACNFVELVLRFTAHSQMQDELATRDPLTGLVNRRAFLERLAQATAGGVILYCDLDHFKPVNDELGHAVGDRVLRMVGDRLADCLRATDLVARLGGDEFAVLCDRATPSSAMMIAERIVAAFEQPFDLEGRPVRVGITIGVAHSTGTLDESVIERADAALRAAKGSRRSAVLAAWDSVAR